MLEVLIDEVNTELAMEILEEKIAKELRKGLTTKDKEIQILNEERKKLYSGDKEIVKKILTQYSK